MYAVHSFRNKICLNQSLKMIAYILTLAIITAFDWSSDVNESRHNTNPNFSKFEQNSVFHFFNTHYALKSSTVA